MTDLVIPEDLREMYAFAIAWRQEFGSERRYGAATIEMLIERIARAESRQPVSGDVVEQGGMTIRRIPGSGVGVFDGYDQQGPTFLTGEDAEIYAKGLRQQHDAERITKLEAERDALKLQAQIWAQEARAQKSTVHACYEIVTGKTGEPGDWNGAEPIRAYVAELRAKLTELESANKKLEENADFLRRSVGVVHLMISRDDIGELDGDWNEIDLPPRLKKYMLAKLESARARDVEVMPERIASLLDVSEEWVRSRLSPQPEGESNVKAQS